MSGSDNGQPGLGQGLVARVLEVLGRGRAGLVTDVDGTISPIVARPEEALVLPRAREALVGLRDRLALVAVVTGRAVADVRHLVDIPGLTYIGNHGLETFSHGHPQTLPEAQPWVPRLAATLDQIAVQLPSELGERVVIENKGASASLHYRQAHDPDAARRVLLDALARCEGSSQLLIEEGRRVINILPPLAITKGSAVSWLVRAHNLDGVVYLGDDLTDAHAFRALGVLRDTGVRTLSIGVVGPETPPSIRQLADASVPTVAAVAELLSEVVDGLRTSARMETRAPGIGSS